MTLRQQAAKVGATMTLMRHSPALDGLRGVAITLVIASHAFPIVPALPWTVKRFSNLGFYGVQLFFVVSALTLALSWRRTARVAKPSLAAFAIRRLFRIAPGYFLAALGYALLNHAPALPPFRWLTFLTFTNGFSPAQMPTVQGAYTIVPGGWSIAAEYGFYAAFPLLMAVLRTPRSVMLALAASLPAAWIANAGARAIFLPRFGFQATDQFLYYWVATELPVFLAGLLVLALAAQPSVLTFASRHARSVTACAVIGFLALGLLSWPRLPEISHALIAAPYLAAACFAALTLAATARPPSWLTHKLLAQLGQASFSAYLLHFAILQGIEALAPLSWLHQTGLAACVAGGLAFVVALTVTGLASQITYRLIELPFMRLGGRLASAADWDRRQTGRGGTTPRAAPPAA